MRPRSSFHVMLYEEAFFRNVFMRLGSLASETGLGA